MAQTDVSGPLVVTGTLNTNGNAVPEPLKTATSSLALVSGNAQTSAPGQVVPPVQGLSFRNNANNADNLVILDNGQVIQGANAQGAASSILNFSKTTTAIADSTATTVATLTIPNVAASAVLMVIIRAGITAASHTYDSTNVVMYLVTVTRTAGKNAVVVLSSAIGAQIATVAAGSTITTALTAAAIAGAVGATNTCQLQITNVGTPAGTTDTQIDVILLNGAAGGVTIA